MFFAYKSLSARMLVALTTLVVAFNPFPSRSGITSTGSFSDNQQFAQGIIDPAKVVFEPVISGLGQPVFITHADDNSDRLFVLERAGKIRIVKDGSLLSTPFLDMQSIVNSGGSEQGLLALAFHPQFESNGYFYTVHTNSSGAVVLSRFTASPSTPDQASFGTRLELLAIPHPTYTNHNGGTLAFGPDGYLYWSTGDGGGTGDPFNNAQDLTSLLGKVLRMDVNSASPYAVPSTNPFYNNSNPAVRKEIWAYGLRNPWRFSFDSLTHDIYIGDVGQANIEEINFQSANSSGGENYGWRIMEGKACYNPSSGCNQSGKVLPIAEYSHALGCSVTGGYVYRGTNYPSLSGHYFYGDYCSGRVFSIYKDPQLGWQPAVELDDTVFRISTFGEDEQRELYLADYLAGILYNIGYQDPVTISGNVGRGGVTLSYTDGTAKIVTSAVNGSYSFLVPYNWSGTVRPSHTCFTFNPTSLSYSNVTTHQTSQDYTASFDSGSSCANVNVSIAGNAVGNYGLPPGSSLREGFLGVDNGPVKIVSTNNVNILSALRVIWKESGLRTSYSEMMGLPVEQLSSEYWFPWYNNMDKASMDQGFRIANVDLADTTIKVMLSSTQLDSFTLLAGESVRVAYDVNSGPIRIYSEEGTNILAALRVIWKEPGLRYSYSEMMGLPKEQLSSEYWFPWYNNLDIASMDQGFRIAMVNGSGDNTIEVRVAGALQQSFTLAQGASVRVGYAVNDGPAQVVCTTCTGSEKIITSLRVIWKEPGFRATYSEMMGMPLEQLSTEYWYPWYNNADVNSMDQGFRIAMVNASGDNTIEVWVAGIMRASFTLPAGDSVRVGYPVNAGPARIVCTTCSGNERVVTSLRVIWKESGPRTSYSEMMGLPTEALSTEYWFPWYNNLFPPIMDQGFRIAVP